MYTFVVTSVATLPLRFGIENSILYENILGSSGGEVIYDGDHHTVSFRKADGTAVKEFFLVRVFDPIEVHIRVIEDATGNRKLMIEPVMGQEMISMDVDTPVSSSERVKKGSLVSENNLVGGGSSSGTNDSKNDINKRQKGSIVYIRDNDLFRIFSSHA
jgi:hypothetical protein